MASELCAELLLVQLPEPARHRDTSTPQGADLQDYYDKIQTFAGVQTVYWSARVQDPSKGLFVIRTVTRALFWPLSPFSDLQPFFFPYGISIAANSATLVWDSFSVAMEAAKHPDLGPLLVKTAAALAVPPTILYITPETPLRPILDSPATEVIVVTFPPSASAEVKAAWEPAISTLFGKGSAAQSGMRGETGAWMAGGIPYSKPPGKDGQEEGSTAWVHLVGWGSVEEHKAWRETEGFKEHVHLIRGKGEVATEMFHILKV